jgi:diguanylate cyclase (GGDEF)-like protein
MDTDLRGLPQDEEERLMALEAYHVLDTPCDPLFDHVTELAAQICEAPMALITLVDRYRQWFKSSLGLPGISETPREFSFCAHAIRGQGVMEVPDTLQDARFDGNPLVLGFPHFRFYAGMPLRDAQGFALGTLCVLDRQPRVLSALQRQALERLSRLVVALLEQRKADQKLAYLAQFDTLTGLPNRYLLRDRMSQSMARAERSGKLMTLLVLNLDDFKLVSNSHGYAVGDQLLAAVAQRLLSCTRAGDTVSRLMGDEFGIALSDVKHPEEAAQVAQKFLRTLVRPFTLENGAEVYLSASLGVALFPTDGRDADELLKNAEAALHRAKEQGRDSCQFYAPQMNQRALGRLRLESSLRQAVARQEFMLHYQPKIGVNGGRVSGVEALLRWNDPEQGLMSPEDFIPVLEDTGLILPVGLWVLETACAQMRTWWEAGIEVPSMAVNLSVRQFLQPELDLRIGEIIRRHGLPPAAIELEITESMLMHDPQQAVQILGRLKQLGVRLSVDDFGTGYSSLAYLKQFPLDALKIDRAFISNITSDADDAAIAIAIVNLAHNLNLKVVAEGVETGAQVNFLIQQGCDILQGFYFAKPMDAHTCGHMLREVGRPALFEHQEEVAHAPREQKIATEDIAAELSASVDSFQV